MYSQFRWHLEFSHSAIRFIYFMYDLCNIVSNPHRSWHKEPTTMIASRQHFEKLFLNYFNYFKIIKWIAAKHKNTFWRCLRFPALAAAVLSSGYKWLLFELPCKYWICSIQLSCTHSFVPLLAFQPTLLPPPTSKCISRWGLSTLVVSKHKAHFRIVNGNDETASLHHLIGSQEFRCEMSLSLIECLSTNQKRR